jgi:hypothetical protein
VKGNERLNKQCGATDYVWSKGIGVSNESKKADRFDVITFDGKVVYVRQNTTKDYRTTGIPLNMCGPPPSRLGKGSILLLVLISDERLGRFYVTQHLNGIVAYPLANRSAISSATLTKIKDTISK